VIIPIENQELAISIALKTSKSSTDIDIKDVKGFLNKIEFIK
jgi:hypothetical protein